VSDLEPRDGASNPVDRIGELLRATGRRPGAPPDRAERVRGAVAAEWRAAVRRRSRRRRGVWLAATLATAATLAAVVFINTRERGGGAPAGGTAALVEVVVNAAWSRTSASPRTVAPTTLRPGDAVEVGAAVATEDRGRLALRLPSGHSLRLDSATRVRFVSDRSLELESGAVYVDSRGPRGDATGFVEIRTPLGRIRDIGTQFEVRRLPEALLVRVREGKVAFDGAQPALELDAGHELRLGENGSVTRRELPATGAEWSWAASVAPLLELEGRTLQQFLDWIARERGLTLRFAGAEAAAAAPQIVLEGSIEGLSLDEALDAVLPTCRLTHRIEGDVLIVDSADRAMERS
jgi:ferric-dicitrate binding protein FerR (iron transport regulator)